ncbi:hypothetical protein B0H17DRAFT_1137393 [Mycena rosella]|uniref:Uncharacterized protein n=1 Tax=Mycena rosella TaxID=1033263 RepID=A0AAD7D8G3_MYCRO|nr:hypothetical protein B0H17DRAFT_1137393 [Mycena rosella]
MSSLSGRILKADHTFKTVDHQGRLPGGEPIHTALYNVVNDSEEGFSPLQGMYERAQVEFARHAHGPTEAIYTDNLVVNERNWHESVTPSLKRNVQHIVLNPFRDLPEFKVSGPSSFASSPDRIDTLCDIILQSLPVKDSIYIALSVIALMVQIPLTLKSVLTHPQIIKFGHEITAAAKHLSSAWGLSIPSSSLVDLGKLAKLKGAAAEASCSLSTLCGAVLNLQLREPNVSTSSLPLTSQVDDLAREVDCVWSVQQALMKLGAVGIPLQPSQLRPAQLVALVIRNKPQAWGELAEHDGYLVIPKRRARCP